MNSIKNKKTILITRAAHQAGETVQKYQKKGFRVLCFPTIEIKPPRSWKKVDRSIQQIEKYDWIIFTSANAVDAFFNQWRGMARGCHSEPLRLRSGQAPAKNLTVTGRSFASLRMTDQIPRIATIGLATKRAVLKHGWKVSAVAKEERSEGLLKLFCHSEPLRLRSGQAPAKNLTVSGRSFPRQGGVRMTGQRILWPRAAKVRPVLAKGLKRLGVRLDQVVVYRSVCPKGKRRALQKLLKTHKIDNILFMSELTRRYFFRILGKNVFPFMSSLRRQGSRTY